MFKILCLVLGKKEKWKQDRSYCRYSIKPSRFGRRCSLSKWMSCQVLFSPLLTDQNLNPQGSAWKGAGDQHRVLDTGREQAGNGIVQTAWLGTSGHLLAHDKCIQSVAIHFSRESCYSENLKIDEFSILITRQWTLIRKWTKATSFQKPYSLLKRLESRKRFYSVQHFMFSKE